MKTKLFFYLALLTFGFTNAQNQKFLSKAEEQKIYETLKTQAIYDKETEVSYIFGILEENEKTRYVAQKHNIFYATPNVLNLYIENQKDAERLKTENNTLKKVAEKVYQLKVTGNMPKAKETYQKKQGVKYVVYEYQNYLNSCVTWNDSEATNTWGGGYGQGWLSNVDWQSAGVTNAVTHAIDSVDTWKQMHLESNISNPNIVIDNIDQGVNVNHSEFSGNILFAYDFQQNVTGNPNFGDHGMATSSITVAKANNNFGGVGVAHSFPLRALDCFNSVNTSTGFYNAYDNIYNDAVAFPNRKHIVNMSYGHSGVDPIEQTKIQQSYNLQNNTQVFFVAASGNDGNSVSVGYPANLSEVIAVGGTTIGFSGGLPIRTLWSSSQTGPGLDFVADATDCPVLQANGQYTVGAGTSYATPIIAGAIAHLVAQDPTANFQTIYNRLKGGAKDYGTVGFDNSYGWGYARTASSLKYAVVEDVPLTIDCAGNSNYTYNFTPKFYNHATKTVNRKCYYPNGQQVPFITNGDGTVTFQIVINTNNGFSATNPAVNRLRYEFTPLGYSSCLTSIKSKPITITNLATLGINEVSLEDSFSIYPNPANDFIIINNPNWIKSKTIYSITGQLVKKENNQNEKIDISNLQQGVYLLEIETTENQKVIKKIIKE